MTWLVERAMNVNFIILMLCTIKSGSSLGNNHLYSDNDHLTILTNDNFSEIVLTRGKDEAWIIQFYNAWCGHCRRFAPVFKDFCKSVKGWSGIISVGVVACSDSKNIPLCRKYGVSAYPTMMIFSPSSVVERKILQLFSQEPSEMRFSLSRFLMNMSENEIPKPWHNFKPLRSPQDLLSQRNKKIVILVHEDAKSVIGIQLILDNMKEKQILIRRLIDGSVMKLKIVQTPSLYLLDTELVPIHLASGTGNADNDKRRFQALINQLILNRKFSKQANQDEIVLNDHFNKATKLNDDRKMIQTEGASQKVHVLDILSALHISFQQEVAVHKEISEESLTSLKTYIGILYKFLPLTDRKKIWLLHILKMLSSKTAITGYDWMKMINKMQIDVLSSNITWVNCKGSQDGYRGYPCGLWTLFHTLTVNAYLSDDDVHFKDVIYAIIGYIKHFFGCSECKTNFLKMADNVDQDITVKKDIVVWLWRAHNKVNRRLHGDITEDPLHPKIQFPAKHYCPQCYHEKSMTWKPVWKIDAVFDFLVTMYKTENIIYHFSKQKQFPYRLQRYTAIPKTALQILTRKPRDHLVNYKIGDLPVYNNQFELSNNFYSDNLDVGLCLIFYVLCSILIFMLYLKFVFRTKHHVLYKCCQV